MRNTIQPAIRNISILLSLMLVIGCGTTKYEFSRDLPKTKAPEQEDFPDAGAVILLHEQSLRDDRKKGLIYAQALIVKILNERGLRFATFETPEYPIKRFEYDLKREVLEEKTIDEKEAVIVRARVQKKDGTIINASPKDVYEVNVSDYSSQKRIILPNVEVGDIVQFETTLKKGFPLHVIGSHQKEVLFLSPPEHFYHHVIYPQQEEPVIWFRYYLTVDSDQQIQSHSVPEDYFEEHVRQGFAEQKHSTTYIWQKENIPAEKIEPHMPPINSVTPHLCWNLFNNSAWPNDRSRWNSWENVSERYYRNLIDAPCLEHQGIVAQLKSIGLKKTKLEEKVDGILVNIDSDIEKAKAIYSYLKENFDIFRSGWEQKQIDEEDDAFWNGETEISSAKAASLMRRMLLRAGIQSEIMMIRTKDRGEIDREVPSNQWFNNALLKLYIADETVWIDFGCETCPFGEIHHNAGDVDGMKVFNTDGDYSDKYIEEFDRFFESIPPIADFEKNRKVDRIKITMNNDGSAVISNTSEYFGQEAIVSRSKYINLESEDKKKETIKETLVDLYPNSKLVEYSIDNLFEYDSTFRLRYTFHVPDFLTQAGDVRYMNPIGLSKLRSHPFVVTKRTYPVIYPYQRSEIAEITIEMPEEFAIAELPEDRKIGDAYGQYVLNFNSSNSTMVCRRELIQKATAIPAESYDELRAFSNHIVSADDSIVLFKEPGD